MNLGFIVNINYYNQYLNGNHISHLIDVILNEDVFDIPNDELIKPELLLKLGFNYYKTTINVYSKQNILIKFKNGRFFQVNDKYIPIGEEIKTIKQLNDLFKQTERNNLILQIKSIK